MKKLYYLSAAALVAMTLASCSNEDVPAPTPTGDGTVTLNVNLPAELATRTYGDGTKATDLYYAVYESGSKTPVVTSLGEVHFTGLRATVTLKLVNGVSYDIIWWAQSPDAKCYTFQPAEQTVTVDWDDVVTNDENRDAFFQHTSIANVAGAFEKDVYLYRPFSQVNIGTNDATEGSVVAAYGQNLSKLQTSITVTEYNTLNLLDGTVSGEQKAVTYQPAGVPPTDETFPVAGYQYLSMDYLLVPADKQLVDITFNISGNGNTVTRNLPNIPVQRNYRTNIYGQMLSADGVFNVIIEPAFEKPDYDVPVWNGEVASTLQTDEQGNVTLSRPEEVALVAKQVNEGTNNFSGKTLKLANDMDLAGIAWTPIGQNDASVNRFQGTFDGQGHTISNLTINNTQPVDKAAGLFGSLPGTVKNLNLENVKITNISSGATSGNGAAAVAGSLFPGGTVQGCTVKNVTINSNRYAGAIAGYAYGSCIDNTVDGVTINLNLGDASTNDKAGGIVGYVGEGSYKITGNTVNNANITALRNVGGIAGCTNDGVEVSGNTVTNSFLYWTSILGTDAGDSKAYSNGYIVGRPINSILSNNTYTNTVLQKK